MKRILFLIALCAMLTTMLSAQKQYGGPYNPNHLYTEGEWYKPGKEECGCKPGFYPLNNIVSPTQWGCELQKCVKAGKKKTTPKGVDTIPPPVVPVVPPAVGNTTNIYNQDNSVTVNDYRSYQTINNEACCDKAGLSIHGVAMSRWFGEVDLLRSTDHVFKAAFPVVRLGWQVEGYLKEAPGFKLQFETNVVGFQQNTDPGCTNCVPQDIEKPNLGLQIKATATWQFSKRNSLSVYRKSTTVMLTKREAVPLPDEGWGVELEHKAGPINLHGGWIKNSSKANTIYVGLSANAFEKSSGQSKDRSVYNPDEKLSSKRSEARDQRRTERREAREQRKVDRAQKKKQARANK